MQINTADAKGYFLSELPARIGVFIHVGEMGKPIFLQSGQTDTNRAALKPESQEAEF